MEKMKIHVIQVTLNHMMHIGSFGVAFVRKSMTDGVWMNCWM